MEIDSAALRENCQRLTSMGKEGGRHCEILAVVKADAYGLGPAAVELMYDWGIRRFGVASSREGIALRERGIGGEIVLLGGFFPEEVQSLLTHRLTPVISTLDDFINLSCYTARAGRIIDYHLEIDTGMGRMGLLYSDFDERWRQEMAKHPLLRLQGVMTHFSCAESDPAYTRTQFLRFGQFLERSGLDGPTVPNILRHCSNSAGFLFFPELRLDMVRVGIALYGVSPTGDPDLIKKAGLKPVMSLKARIRHVKDLPAGFCVGYGATATTSCPSRIAVLPVGYAQGLPRNLSNRMAVLVRGRRARSIGVLSMDQMMVDVTEIPGVTPGDTAIVIGRDPGGEEITVEEVARQAQTIPHEILCSLVRVKNRIVT